MQNNHAIHPNTRKSYNFSLKTRMNGQIGSNNPMHTGHSNPFWEFSEWQAEITPYNATGVIRAYSYT